MAYIQHLLTRIFTSITNNIFIKILIGIWLYFAGIHIYLFCIGGLVIFDVITGIAASIKSGMPFKSQYLKKGLLEKVALYLILILSAFMLGSILKSIYPYQHFFIVFFIAILISSYECVSICENILRINPSLTFINSFINLSNRITKSAVDSVDKKIDVLEGEETKDELKEKSN